MQTTVTNNIGTLFILLAGIFLITSCLELSGENDAMPVQLQGKWKLVRVEETVKTVAPPSVDKAIWIEFTEITPNTVTDSGFPYSFNGEALVNLYFGGYRFSGTSLSIGPVGATKRGGPAEHMAFDSYYFNKLNDAKSYYIHENNQTLVIETKENHLLIFTRFDNAD